MSFDVGELVSCSVPAGAFLHRISIAVFASAVQTRGRNGLLPKTELLDWTYGWRLVNVFFLVTLSAFAFPYPVFTLCRPDWVSRPLAQGLAAILTHQRSPVTAGETVLVGSV